MDVEQIAFTIIAHAGEAKSLAYSALREAEKNNFEKAENLIKEARTEINQSKQTEKKHLLKLYLFILRIILRRAC